MGTPTVHCFLKKERVENITGVKMKSEWRSLFEKHTGVTSKSASKTPVSV